MLTIVKRSDLLQDSPVFGLDALSSAAYGPEAALPPFSRSVHLELKRHHVRDASDLIPQPRA
jgi:hypothetical protein